MINCKICHENTILEVAENDGLKFYSCCNELCDNYAELLVKTSSGLTSIHNVLDTYKAVVNEIVNERDKVRRS